MGRGWRAFRLSARRLPASALLLPVLVLAVMVGGSAPALAVGEDACPNAQLRAENGSTGLPDCRAYEQVTPEAKNGRLIEVANNLALGTSGISAIAPNGSQALVSVANSKLAGGENTPIEYGGLYALTRGGSGWDLESLAAPASLLAYSASAPLHAVDGPLQSATDLRGGIFFGRGEFEPARAADFYRREQDGAYVEIGPIAPASQTAGASSPIPESEVPESTAFVSRIGASLDLSHLFFALRINSGSALHLEWPGDATVAELPELPSLYEYVGTGHTGAGADIPALVGVDDEGAQIGQCGTGLGRTITTNAATGEVANDREVSAGGSTVFFTVAAGGCAAGATGPAVNQLYARIGQPGAQTTVNVAGTSGCAASDSCNVTVAPVYQGASADGSRVFFTTGGELDLCGLPGDGGQQPVAAKKVDPCPELVPVSGAGAEVQSIAGISEDGSHVYFVAKGVLAGNEDADKETAKAGADNLYVYERDAAHPAGALAFIAALPSASLAEAQVTPDGEFLVFTSAGDLTPDDTSSVAQAFRYDARTGELVRVSAGQGGFDDNGNTSVNAAKLAAYNTVSADGSYVVFQSKEALTNQVSQVSAPLNNVYEWHEGVVSLLSSGVNFAENAFSRTALAGIGSSGGDVFFVTPARLVPGDSDELPDLYDARIDGGFPAPPARPSCAGEACQGSPGGPLSFSAPGSTGAPTVGNLATAPLATPTPTVSKPKPRPKPLTRAQELAKALKQCGKDKSKKQRRSCEKQAQKRYAPVKTQAKKTTRTRRGR